jgi:hypothetical protein
MPQGTADPGQHVPEPHARILCQASDNDLLLSSLTAEFSVTSVANRHHRAADDGPARDEAAKPDHQ